MQQCRTWDTTGWRGGMNTYIYQRYFLVRRYSFWQCWEAASRILRLAVRRIGRLLAAIALDLRYRLVQRPRGKVSPAFGCFLYFLMEKEELRAGVKAAKNPGELLAVAESIDCYFSLTELRDFAGCLPARCAPWDGPDACSRAQFFRVRRFGLPVGCWLRFRPSR